MNKQKIIDYIELLEAKAYQSDDYFKQRNELYILNQKYKEVLDKIKEYGENCLENLKDQDDFINESVNVVALLKMIHQNYLELLEEIE